MAWDPLDLKLLRATVMPKALDQSIILKLICFISNSEVKKNLLCRDFHTAEWIRKMDKRRKRLIIFYFIGIGFFLHFKPTGEIFTDAKKG